MTLRKDHVVQAARDLALHVFRTQPTLGTHDLPLVLEGRAVHEYAKPP